MNKAILVGRLTKDPELKMTENTKREVCQFTIAVNRPYTNEDGERKADFINCVVWDKLAENLSKYQKKGNNKAGIYPYYVSEWYHFCISGTTDILIYSFRIHAKKITKKQHQQERKCHIL